MRIAVLSDIHGNYHALRACVSHAIGHGATTFWFLGDYVGEFPKPQRVMTYLYNLQKKYDCVFLRGNKEDYYIDGKFNPDCDWLKGNQTTGALKYTLAHLTAKDLSFFRDLPISTTIHTPGMPDILLCHGSAENNKQKLLPDDSQTEEIVQSYPEPYIICGHTHKQGIIKADEQMVLNAGSVGVPLGCKHSAQYMLLETVDGRWQPTFVSLPLDVDIIEKEMTCSDILAYAPAWCSVVIQVLRTGKYSQGTVLNEAMKMDQYQSPYHSVPDACWEKALAHYDIPLLTRN